MSSEPVISHQGFRPSTAFVGVSWIALFIGILSFVIGLWHSTMQLSEKGYYFTVLIYGLFSAVSVQKSVRDRLEGIPVTGIYFGLSWLSVLFSLVLLGVGLYNATFALIEKGFYGIAFMMSLFAAVTVQKNIRDNWAIDKLERPIELANNPNEIK